MEKEKRAPYRSCNTFQLRYAALQRKPGVVLDQVPGLALLSHGAAIQADRFGERAARLAALHAIGLAVPDARLLPVDVVARVVAADVQYRVADLIVPGAIVALRSSPPVAAWGGPTGILGIGIGNGSIALLTRRIGGDAARRMYCRFIQNFASAVDRLEHEAFEGVDGLDVDACKNIYAEETGADFPEDAGLQLQLAIKAMLRDWRSASARILRQAKGAPTDAGLALMVQDMVIGPVGVARFVDAVTGEATLDCAMTDSRAVAQMPAIGSAVTNALGDRYDVEFAVEKDKIWLLDAERAKRNARASVTIAVDLANSGAISRDEAILRVDPRNLIEHLHPQISPDALRDVFCLGMAASPGAATGAIVFSAGAAQAMAVQGLDCVLVRSETSAEDIRGMQVARAVLTVRGGMTSHAAVIARGLGLPCVVGASDLKLSGKRKILTALDGRVFREGDIITIDGTRGQALAGAVEMVPAALGGAFATLMQWADARRELGVRANADTPQDARVARGFRADGIGLCRTEHMFFEENRINVMREMILADNVEERRAALERLLPIQRADFEELFAIMHGLPVTIRLLDPPLHEFLPSDAAGIQDLAKAMDLPVALLTARAGELAEVNPMLGMRGVRLGVVMPEIYEMQARAIFEATVAVNLHATAPVEPEVMIPLVSANREVELVKARIDAVAALVRAETGSNFSFRLGVMVETPRAALRSGDLAKSSAFLSFGTNDLTQMTYGLSRDDAGRFMRDYVNQGVFPEDPFHTLDLEGVGELLLTAARRGREANPDLVLGLCGEHGGDPASVRFCKLAGFDYVSCSPFRVPIARLAAAQATILSGNLGTAA